MEALRLREAQCFLIQLFNQLKKNLRGELLLPTDSVFDETRKVWNRMIDKCPALIARCHGTVDVLRCVEFAREHKLLVAVRGGGHNIAGKSLCDDGLLIDLSSMKGIHVDPRGNLRGPKRD